MNKFSVSFHFSIANTLIFLIYCAAYYFIEIKTRPQGLKQLISMKSYARKSAKIFRLFAHGKVEGHTYFYP